MREVTNKSIWNFANYSESRISETWETSVKNGNASVMLQTHKDRKCGLCIILHLSLINT